MSHTARPFCVECWYEQREKRPDSQAWIDRWKNEARTASPSRQIADQRLGTRYINDFRSRETVALQDILQYKASSLPFSPVEIDHNGRAVFNLPSAMAKPLGLGENPISISDTSPDFQNSAVHDTTGLAIWLKPDFFDVHSASHQEEFEGTIRTAIIGFCDALSAKHQIAIYPAFIPIDSANSAASSVLVLMSDSKGQDELLGPLHKDLLRELTKIRDTAPDNPNKPSSASR